MPGVTDFLQEFVDTFETLMSWYVYAYFKSRINGVSLIDTDVERCDLRTIRNESSDVERSLWLFYTPLQNLIYQVLYPDAVIEMIWFDSCATDEVVAGIADFMNDLLAMVSLETLFPRLYARLPSYRFRSAQGRRASLKREQPPTERLEYRLFGVL